VLLLARLMREVPGADDVETASLGSETTENERNP
jgi:hypothetical protein